MERKHTFPHYSQYYDEESREFVAQLYRKDIQAFGYSFESSRSTFTAPRQVGERARSSLAVRRGRCLAMRRSQAPR